MDTITSLGKLDKQSVAEVWQLHTRDWVVAGWHEKGSESVRAEFQDRTTSRRRTYDAVSGGRAWLIVVPEEGGMVEFRLLGFRSDGSAAFTGEPYASLSECLSYHGVVGYAFVEGLGATE